VKKGIWEGRIRKNTNQKNLGLYYRSQGNVQTMKGKNLPSIQKQERRDLEFCG